MRKGLVVTMLMACCASASAALMPSMKADRQTSPPARLAPMAMLQAQADATPVAPARAEPDATQPAASAPAQAALRLSEPGMTILLLGGVVLLAVALRQRARRLAASRPGRYRH